MNYLGGALCNGCESFVKRCITKEHKTNDALYWIKSPLVRTIRAINASAGECCWLCNNLLLAMTHDDGVQLGEVKRLSMFTPVEDQRRIRVFSDTKPEPSKKLIDFRIDTMAEPSKNNAHPLWNTGRKTWSEEACHTVERWIEACDREHRTCMSSPLNASSNYQPTRLIDLRTAASGILRLVCNASDRTSRHSYVALSHCWGATRFAMLQIGNLSSYLEGFSLDLLPKTYKEAIIVCRDLNIDYLWIDSLCILQDSEDDWATESRQMGDIFSHAVFTIATPAARADEQGFIREQNQYLTTDLVFVYPRNGRPHRQYSLHREENMDTFVNNARLNTRGWVLQERALSRRILYFAHDQIYWQCQSSLEAQFNLHYVNISAHSSIDLARFFGNVMDDSIVSHPKIERSRFGAIMDWRTFSDRDDLVWMLLRKWRQLIEEYSRCNLTFATDTFMAVSGLAGKIANFANWDQDNYLAGHWRENFIESLLWSKVNGPGRRQANTAPSWSWASVHSHQDAQIEWTLCAEGTKPLAKAIDCTFKRDGNPRDLFAEGVLTIEGHLCEIRIGKPWFSGKERLTTLKMKSNQWTKVTEHWWRFSFGFDHEDQSRNLNRDTLFMPLVWDSFVLGGLMGLILRPYKTSTNDDTSNGRFVRLGMAVVTKDVADLVMAACTSASIETSNYVTFDGKDKYTIEIV